jgi:hypothetical protein
LDDTAALVQRPAGITVVGALFLLAGGYLVVTGGIMLLLPGRVSMAAGTPLLNGLELAGPYMFCLVGGVGGLVGFGLLRLNNWARRCAILIALAGLVMLIPSVSASAVDFRPGLFWNGLGVVVRAAVVWYLYQIPVTLGFRKS